MRNNNRDIGGQGALVVGGGTKDDETMVRVASQFVGANLKEGWGRLQIRIDYKIDGGRLDTIWGSPSTSGRLGDERYELLINMQALDHRTNPSSIARTLTHESLHRGRGFSVSGAAPSHRALDDNAKALIKQWGLAGSGCPAAGSRTGFLGLFGPQFYSGC